MIQTKMTNSHIVGIDIGGTNIKAGLFNTTGDLIEWKITPSLIEKGRDVTLKRITNLIKKLEKNRESLLPVTGIVVTGIIDKKREYIVHSPNLLGCDNFYIKQALQEKLKRKIVLENDANGAALGELWKGEGKEFKNFMLLTLGTGLGSGLVINRKLWTGDDGSAAEIGHTKIVPGGLKCGCGAKGCLEMYFSNRAIERLVRKSLKNKSKTILKRYPLSQAISSKLVYNIAKKGDTVAIKIYRDISRYLGIAIANVINLLGIKNFILSGGISNASDLFIPFLIEEVNKNLFYPFSKDFTILKGKLGNTAGATGAAYLALQRV
jgi:glucokinase